MAFIVYDQHTTRAAFHDRIGHDLPRVAGAPARDQYSRSWLQTRSFARERPNDRAWRDGSADMRTAAHGMRANAVPHAPGGITPVEFRCVDGRGYVEFRKAIGDRLNTVRRFVFGTVRRFGRYTLQKTVRGAVSASMCALDTSRRTGDSARDFGRMTVATRFITRRCATACGGPNWASVVTD